MASKTISVGENFDNNRFTGYQVLVCSLCFLITFLDGFDLTVVGVALPKIADFLHCKQSALGIALGAGQFGPLIGAVVLGMLADRWGRKWMLFVSAIIFGVFSVLIAFITSVEQLALFRFLAGVGLGGAVPNALTFGSEYSPTRSRAGIVATMYAGMPAGAMVGGFRRIPHPPFRLAVSLPAGRLCAVSWSALSLRWPCRNRWSSWFGGTRRTTGRGSGRSSPGSPGLLRVIRNWPSSPTAKKAAGVSVKRLFTEGRELTTVLLWITCSAASDLRETQHKGPHPAQKSGATVQQHR